MKSERRGWGRKLNCCVTEPLSAHACPDSVWKPKFSVSNCLTEGLRGGVGAGFFILCSPKTVPWVPRKLLNWQFGFLPNFPWAAQWSIEDPVSFWENPLLSVKQPNLALKCWIGWKNQQKTNFSIFDLKTPANYLFRSQQSRDPLLEGLIAEIRSPKSL